MSISKNLEDAMNGNYWVCVTMKGGLSVYGKVKNADYSNSVEISPYQFSITPFGKEDKFFFKIVEDKPTALRIEEILVVMPIPDEAIKLIQETAKDMMREKKVGL